MEYILLSSYTSFEDVVNSSHGFDASTESIISFTCPNTKKTFTYKTVKDVPYKNVQCCEEGYVLYWESIEATEDIKL